MFQEPLTLYKLIILYMLDRVTYPLTTAQISDFILEKEYTDFLTLQQAICELTDAGMISPRTVRNRTLLTLTSEGSDTLHFFNKRISAAIKEDVDAYLKDHDLELRNEISVQSNYYKSTSGEYEARLVAKDHEINLVDITLSVPTEQTAASICDNWQKKNEEIYGYLVRELF